MVLRVDLHCNKEVIFLWQLLQLLRYSSESIALMKAEVQLPVELWQLFYLLSTFIIKGNSFIQQVFTIKTVGSSKFVEIITLNLVSEAF